MNHSAKPNSSLRNPGCYTKPAFEGHLLSQKKGLDDDQQSRGDHGDQHHVDDNAKPFIPLHE